MMDKMIPMDPSPAQLSTHPPFPHYELIPPPPPFPVMSLFLSPLPCYELISIQSAIILLDVKSSFILCTIDASF